jgi:hypothetical protein
MKTNHKIKEVKKIKSVEKTLLLETDIIIETFYTLETAKQRLKEITNSNESTNLKQKYSNRNIYFAPDKENFHLIARLKVE